MIQSLLQHIPAPRHAREYVEVESAMVKIAALTGYPYELIQSACREVASHYPLPARFTLEKLYVDVAGNYPTVLAQDFYREYEKAKQRTEHG